ncbi:hypothetical protein GH714_040860 [Hevea brasiliensis]|uniref:Protein kinase domain-containing protein n=1 Tax=Hevea brasiliensis TaxID=3981 RepID=A0A6A6MU14_HEVBR|nr:hypothetical protein GH714_040860 [Hevea brasiliensis]
MGLTAMVLLAMVFIRWQKRPNDWQKRKSFSSWLLPLHTNQSTFLSSKSSSRRSSIFGSRKSKSGNSGYFNNQGLGRYFTFSELQNATLNFDEKIVIGVGGFGKVYFGELEDGTKTAIKRGNRVLSRACHKPSTAKGSGELAEWAMQWYRKGMIDKIIDPQIAGTINPGSLKKYVEAAEKCLAEYGVDRPGMGDVLWNLEYALQLQEASSQPDISEDKSTNLIALKKPSRRAPEGESAVSISDDSEVTLDSPMFSELGNFQGSEPKHLKLTIPRSSFEPNSWCVVVEQRKMPIWRTTKVCIAINRMEDVAKQRSTILAVEDRKISDVSSHLNMFVDSYSLSIILYLD